MSPKLSFSIVVTGKCKVGKSSFIDYFINGASTIRSKPTIGVNVNVIDERIMNDYCKVKLKLIDLGGQSRFSSIIAQYYTNIAAIFMMFDITERFSYIYIKSMLPVIRSKASPNTVIYLVGTKGDQAMYRQVDKLDVINFAFRENLRYYETSARSGKDIAMCFNAAITEICHCWFSSDTMRDGCGIVADEHQVVKSRRNSCCCYPWA